MEITHFQGYKVGGFLGVKSFKPLCGRKTPKSGEWSTASYISGVTCKKCKKIYNKYAKHFEK